MSLSCRSTPNYVLILFFLRDSFTSLLHIQRYVQRILSISRTYVFWQGEELITQISVKCFHYFDISSPELLFFHVLFTFFLVLNY